MWKFSIVNDCYIIEEILFFYSFGQPNNGTPSCRIAGLYFCICWVKMVEIVYVG